jgi:hypothetical protein
MEEKNRGFRGNVLNPTVDICGVVSPVIARRRRCVGFMAKPLWLFSSPA